MIVEILKSKDAYVYTSDLSFHIPHKHKHLTTEKINNIYIHFIKFINLPNNNLSKFTNFHFKCKHGKNLNYITSNKLPSENWDELIEFWSCHNNEFASIKNLTIKIRPKGILLSSFYLLINNEDLPSCCKSQENTVKIWFNELSCIDHKNISYDYLEEYFLNNNALIICYNNVYYEIKFFYTCQNLIIKNLIFNRCMKLGIKEKKGKYKLSENINNFYMEFIFKNIKKLDIKVMEYQIGFFYI